MANPEHVAIVKGGCRAINEWREVNPDKWLDISGADISDTDLVGAILTDTTLRHATLTRTNLTDADLTGANMAGAILTRTDLTDANIIDGGVDARGYDFRATWGDGGANLTILAGCKRWTSFDEALAWYGPDYSGDGERHEIRLKLTYMRDLYLMRTKQSEGK